MRSPKRTRGSFIATAFAFFSLAAPTLAHAAGDPVLVLQWPTSGALASNAAGDAVNRELTAIGYAVTLQNTVSTSVPDNVADYKQVYLVSLGLTPDSDAAKLVTYVKGGGHLYVTGDRPDPTNDMESLLIQEKILKLTLKNSTALQVGTGVEGGGVGQDLITLVAEKTGFAAHPAPLASFYAGDPGIIGGVPDDHIIGKDQSGNPIGAVWTQSDLVQGNGCMMLIEDINWWNGWQEVANPPPSHAQVSAMAANVGDFMKYCGDHDLDGILDGEETPLGTDPLNPDTDGDGLCDGTNSVNDPTVTGKCIAGENGLIKQDSDKDGTIDALDTDDDNDGILSKDEVSDVAKFGDPDTDNVHAWLDLDSDDDGVSDHDEGRKEFNTKGVPDYLDPDFPTVGGGGKTNPDGGVGSADGGTISGAGDSGSSGGCGCSQTRDTTMSDFGTASLIAGIAVFLGRKRRAKAWRR
ncbi:MAG: hypothetical protein ABI183_22035 [Polyangiaceae bacterium]